MSDGDKNPVNEFEFKDQFTLNIPSDMAMLDGMLVLLGAGSWYFLRTAPIALLVLVTGPGSGLLTATGGSGSVPRTLAEAEDRNEDGRGSG